MSRQDEKKNTVTPPAETAGGAPAEVPRSGAGAGTAMSAMLKKRQMRVTRDADADPQSPATPARKTGSE
jgi:hypothetical protein